MQHEGATDELADAKPKQPVFFLHIPKCAGSTVWHALRRIYGRDRVLRVPGDKRLADLESMTPEALGSYSAIGGHGAFLRYRRTLKDIDDYYCCVVVRDPVSRLVSFYNHARSRSAHPRFDEAKGETFEEFALKQVPNRQAILLCGGADLGEAVEILGRYFDDWCVAEDVGAFVERLCRHAGTPSRKAVQRNQSRAGISVDMVDPALVARLRQIHAVDQAVYEYCKS